VIFDGVVQQGRAGQVRVGCPVVADDPDRHAQRVVHIRLTLAAVGRVQPGRQRKCVSHSVMVGGTESCDLDR
jgi:hypothetical protein